MEKASLIVLDLPSVVSIIGRRSKQEQLEVKYASGLAATEHSGEEAGWKICFNLGLDSLPCCVHVIACLRLCVYGSVCAGVCVPSHHLLKNAGFRRQAASHLQQPRGPAEASRLLSVSDARVWSVDMEEMSLTDEDGGRLSLLFTAAPVLRKWRPTWLNLELDSMSLGMQHGQMQQGTASPSLVWQAFTAKLIQGIMWRVKTRTQQHKVPGHKSLTEERSSWQISLYLRNHL